MSSSIERHDEVEGHGKVTTTPSVSPGWLSNNSESYLVAF